MRVHGITVGKCHSSVPWLMEDGAGWGDFVDARLAVAVMQSFHGALEARIEACRLHQHRKICDGRERSRLTDSRINDPFPLAFGHISNKELRSSVHVSKLYPLFRLHPPDH